MRVPLVLKLYIHDPMNDYQEKPKTNQEGGGGEGGGEAAAAAAAACMSEPPPHGVVPTKPRDNHETSTVLCFAIKQRLVCPSGVSLSNFS